MDIHLKAKYVLINDHELDLYNAYSLSVKIGELLGVYQFNSGNRKIKGLVTRIRNEKKVFTNLEYEM